MSEFDFKERIQEWITIKKQLRDVRKDISTLNQREKDLKKFLQVYMKQNDIDVCNTQIGKVTYTKRKTKGSYNRENVREGLLEHFSGNEQLVTEILQTIENSIKPKNTETLSIRMA
jgi:hypothetical protein